jgi:cytoskeletal protein CcmA (bactofilin family)
MEPPQNQQAAAPDALEKPTDPNDATEVTSTTSQVPGGDGKPPKKQNALKKFFKRFNIYLLIFIFIVVVAAAVSIVSYLNSKKVPKAPSIATQQLTQDALSQLSNSDATVGGSGQTLSVQGNAIFSGQVLIRSDLSVAGSIKAGGGIAAPQITISGKANLSDTQINSLQVANNSTFQGTITLQKDLNVGGTTAFSGPVTAGQITVTKLILSGNASLQIPNHIAFTGASPSRSAINGTTLGAGGTASINGSDTTGTVNINSGNNPAPGCFITLTFNQVFTSAPHVLISPVGSAAGQTNYYVDRSTTGFSVCTANAAPANQTFAYDYFVTQ